MKDACYSSLVVKQSIIINYSTMSITTTVTIIIAVNVVIGAANHFNSNSKSVFAILELCNHY